MQDRGCAWDPHDRWAPIVEDRVRTVDDVYGPLREGCPVLRSSTDAYWVALRHEDVLAITRDTDTFSNVAPLYETRRPPLESDPPEHTAYRRMLNPYFSSERMAALEPVVRRFTDQMLQPLIHKGQADVAQELTHPLPSRVLCALLGIPDEDWVLINGWSTETSNPDTYGRPRPASLQGVGGEMRRYILDLVAARQGSDGDDVISRLLREKIRGEDLDVDMVTGVVLLMITAGHNTTTSAMGNTILRLARDSDLQQRLRADAALIPAVIEESLRLEAPQQAMRRIVTTDVVLGGSQLRAGDWIYPAFGAANLDEEAFGPDAATFRVDRNPNRHVAFGFGRHKCIGAPLARMEVRVLIEQLLARTTGIHVAGPVRRAGWPRMGVTQMELALTDESRAGVARHPSNPGADR